MRHALDLFCGAGGAARGLSAAGFYVLGVDIHPQPHYPYHFICEDWQHFGISPTLDFVWASPPCQAFAPIGRQARAQHPNYISALRRKLRAWGGLYCIENVPSAPLERPIYLDGGMFGLNTYRRRAFECNFFVSQPPQSQKFGPKSRPGSVTISGNTGGSSLRDGTQGSSSLAWSRALGIPDKSMLNREMAEAIPPAYSRHIALAAIAALQKGPSL